MYVLLCFVSYPRVNIWHSERKTKQNTHEENGVGISAYLTILIYWYQAFDGYIPDVAAAKEDFACRG